MVKLLIEHSANVTAKDKVCKTNLVFLNFVINFYTNQVFFYIYRVYVLV